MQRNVKAMSNTRLAACILTDCPPSEIQAAAAGGLDCAAGVPALVLAASLLNVEAAATLLRCGADVNAPYAREPFAGWKALHFAAAAPCGPDTGALLATLLTAGADVTASTTEGFWVTDLACSDHPATAQRLVAAGAPPPSAARRALHIQTQARAIPRLHAVVDELEVSAVCEELLLGGYCSCLRRAYCRGSRLHRLRSRRRHGCARGGRLRLLRRRRRRLQRP